MCENEAAKQRERKKWEEKGNIHRERNRKGGGKKERVTEGERGFHVITSVG